MTVLENVYIALSVYAAITLLVFVASVSHYQSVKRLELPVVVRKEAAQDVLLSPLWPLVVVTFVVRGFRSLWGSVMELVRDARREV